MKPSSFARYCLPLADRSLPLLDAGCGNGRDLLYFAAQGIDVIGVDLSETGVTRLRERIPSAVASRVGLHVGDVTNLPEDGFRRRFGTVYSRFVLHAFVEEGERRFLRWAAAHAADGGRLMIEARSVLGSLYGLGEPCGRDAFIHGHYRRFIRRSELEERIREVGFVIEESVEADGLTVCGKDDPVVIRVVARKPGA